MKTIWIGERAVDVDSLVRRIGNDIDWLQDLHQDIQSELASKRELLAWLDQDTMTDGRVDATIL